MAIIRVQKNKNYTVMANYHLREKSMSLKAKGLLSLMLSLPDGWDYSIAGLVTLSKDNKAAIKSTLKELKSFGYLKITMLKPDKTENRPRITYVYDVFETPLPEEERENKEEKIEKDGVKKQETENRSSVDKSPVKSSISKNFLSSQGTKKQETEKQSTENQATENQPQINTKEISTKETNTNIKKESKKERKFSPQQVESNKKENLDSPKVSDSAINGKKISDSKKSKTFEQLIEEYTTNEELRKELKEHLKVRKLKKAALTDRAVELSLSELNKIAAADYEKIQIVRNSIMNGWTGFFPLKKDEHDRLINSLAQHKPSYDIEAYKAMDVFGDWTPEDDAKMEEFNEDDTKKKYKFKSWDGVQ